MTISIQYDPSNLMLQNSIDKSTNSINNSLTRLSSGYRINKAADDSAGLYISSNLNTSIRGYAVVNKNAQNALSYLNLASSSLSDMTNVLSRMRDLAVTASTETYDSDSRAAMQTETDKLAEQLSNTKSSTEFNGIKVFENDNTSGAAGTTGTVGTSGTVGTYAIQALTEEEAIAQGYTVIKTEDELKAMANNLNGKYILMNDIELTEDWTPIGTHENGVNDYATKAFKGQFNGNGHTISNVKIDQSETEKVLATGFFGCVSGANAKIENVNLENVDVKGQTETGGLVGLLYNKATVSNCSSTGSVTGTRSYTGGLVGSNNSSSTISNSYATGSVEGKNYTGGLVGWNYSSSTITNSYATGKVEGEDYIGGLVGSNHSSSTISNCYAKGNADGSEEVGGLVGYNFNNSTITNSYATGNATGTSHTGGLVGWNNYYTKISNCYATGIADSTSYTGGLVGSNETESSITNSYSTGEVKGVNYIGGFAGYNYVTSTITNSYSTGDVNANNKYIGGFCGCNSAKEPGSTSTASLIENCYSTGKIRGVQDIGAFVGLNRNSNIKSGFYNSDTAESLGGVGSVIGTCNNDVTGLKTGEFNDSSIFQNAGWTTKNWYFNAGGAPKCAWQKATENIREFQIGIDEKKNSIVTVATGLDTSDFKVDLTDRESALKSIDKIDSILNTIMKKNTEIGSSQNRLESIMNSQTIRKTSLTASKSTILDADVAEESSKYVNSQIRQQCSSALMSQVRNTNPALIMQLINATKF